MFSFDSDNIFRFIFKFVIWNFTVTLNKLSGMHLFISNKVHKINKQLHKIRQLFYVIVWVC